MIPVLCSTTGKRRPYGLRYLGDYEYIEERNGRWCEAANALLDRVAGSAAWFVDDDIEFVTLMDTDYPFDVTGFNLYAPVGTQIALVSAGHNLAVDHIAGTVALDAERDPWIIGNAALHAHVTASCLWLSAKATERLRFPVWKGEHYEDVVFTLQAWLDGLTVGRVNVPVLHHMNIQAGVGATKALMPGFLEKRMVNEQALQHWMKDNEIYEAVVDGSIPYRAILHRVEVLA